jgi:branched-chain amino acid transport system permease protein
MAFFRTWVGKVVLLLVLGGALYYLGEVLGNRRVFNPYYFRVIMLSGIAAILAVSLNLVNGVTGQFSIGHAGFMAIGAYTGAALTVYGQYRFLPPLQSASPLVQSGAMLLALLAAGALAALMGLLVGLPSLRLRGDYLAIVTLGFGEIMRVAILNIDAVGGSSGFRGYSSPHGYIGIPSLTTFFWVFGVLAVLVLLSRNLLHSTPGLSFFAVREDEVAAEAMGVRTTAIKVTAFVMSAFFAGVAGALYAHYDPYLQPDTFGFLRSIEIVTMVVLGGSGSITGSLLGAVILTATPELLRVGLDSLSRTNPALAKNLQVDLLRQLLYASLLVVLMLTRPQGIMGSREVSIRGLFSKRRKEIGTPLTPA